MQPFRALDDFEIDELPSLDGFVAVHFDSRIMGKEINGTTILITPFSGIGVNEPEPLGVVEPLDLADRHAHIPLQQTPSLEYHPVHPQSNL